MHQVGLTNHFKLRMRCHKNIRLLIFLVTVYFHVLIIDNNFIIRYFNSYCKQNGIQLSAHFSITYKCSLLA